MKQQRIFLLLLLLLAAMAACSPGHVGGNEIAFLRDGNLWTIDPDGANAFEIAAGNPPVVSYGWSPTHQILAFRTLDPIFAKTFTAKHLTSNPVTESPGDVPSTLNTIGIDGGSPIPILFSSPAIQYSNAWWNTNGSRLLYREEITATTLAPITVRWWISQNDQPGGIARKSLPGSFSIPSIAPNNLLAIGNSRSGIFTTTLNGTNIQSIVSGTLPGHPLSAALERVLWQPAHAQPDLLYALASSPAQPASAATQVQLVLRDVHGHVTSVATCACHQFAWSPDGKSILYSTGSTYTLFNLNSNSSFAVSGEDGSVPYWSPDSQFLLLDGPHTLRLVKVAVQQQQVLLSDTTLSTDSTSPPVILPGVNALLSPASNSPWAADSRHFLFLTRGRLLWQGKSLSSGKGLNTVSIGNSGQVQGTPDLVDAGSDTQAGWTYEDPNTSFLF